MTGLLDPVDKPREVKKLEFLGLEKLPLGKGPKMLLTLALVIFAAAIITLFSQEFIGLFKKIISIKGAELILPLAAASFVVYKFDFWFVWVLHYYRVILSHMVLYIAWIFPSYTFFTYIAIIAVLTILSVAPVILLDWIFRKRAFKPYPYPYLTSSLIWLISAMTITVV